MSDCGKIYVCYLPPNIAFRILRMDQGIIQNLKGHYKVDFMRKLISEDSSVKEFQSNFIIKTPSFHLHLPGMQ
jgi:hypothetical protein